MAKIRDLPIMTPVYTGLVQLSGSKYFTPEARWAAASLKHNRQYAPRLKVLEADNPGWIAMTKALQTHYPADAKSWHVGTLLNYVALRDFVASGESEMQWLEVDMVINPLALHSERFGICYTRDPFTADNYVPTVFEKAKRSFWAAYNQTKPPTAYQQILSTYMRLTRDMAITILDSFALDLYSPDGWKKIKTVEQSLRLPHIHFFSDMVLELGYPAIKEKVPDAYSVVGWVSYDNDWNTREIIHFDGDNKPKLQAWLDDLNFTALPNRYLSSDSGV